MATTAAKRTPILIAGATGRMGTLMTKHALANPNLQVNVLVRNPKKNPELLSQVEAAGGKVFKGDLSQPKTFKNVTKGMHTVLSAINSFDKHVTIDGQIALIEDSLKNGVKRFAPSDFTFNETFVTREELLESPLTEFRVMLEDYLQTIPIPLLRFRTGTIAETFFHYMAQRRAYWGEDIKHNITTYDNAARLAVAAAARPNLAGNINYSGADVTVREVQDTYNKIRGTNIEIKQAGSLDELKRLAEMKRSEGDYINAGYMSLFAVEFDPKSKLISKDNDKFPEVKPTTVEEFLKQNPSITL